MSKILNINYEQIKSDLQTLPNSQRLIIALYIINKYNLESHLDSIENILKKIFSKSIKTELDVSDYSDFAASCIRFYFNAETRKVKDGLIDEKQRLWQNTAKGHWKNTINGDSFAEYIIKQNNISLETTNKDTKFDPSIYSSYIEQTTANGKSDFVYPEEILPDIDIHEGAIDVVKLNRYERSHIARELCIKHYGAKCAACDFEFKKFYGLGEKYIHVHHLIPIHKIKHDYKIDPIKDLIPICPNCHAMLHMKDPPYDIAELKEHILLHDLL